MFSQVAEISEKTSVADDTASVELAYSACLLPLNAPSSTILFSYLLQFVLLILFIDFLPQPTLSSHLHLAAQQSILEEQSVRIITESRSPALQLPRAVAEGSRGGRPTLANYRGRREIVLRNHLATNALQTIEQPDLVSPPRLTTPLAIPELVQLPAPSATLQPVIKLAPEARRNNNSHVEALAQPTLPLSSAPLPAIAMATHAVPRRPTIAAGAADSSVAVINAIEVRTAQLKELPKAELYANFVVSPSMAVGTSASGGTQGPASRDGMESTAGSEAGKHNPTESGANAGAGPSPFHGLTISGGKSKSAPSALPSSANRQTYGLTIRAGGGSGGALKNFGVFRESDTVYTIFINTAAPGGAADWPLQYALADPAQLPPQMRRIIPQPPTPLRTALPSLPKELLSAFAGRQIVVQAALSKDGKFEQLRVIDSPSEALNRDVLEALAHWELSPASIGGSPVALRVLIGVPLPR